MADVTEESCPDANSLILEGNQVVLKNRDSLRIVQVWKNRKVTFEKLHFFLDSAIGCPLGSVFEVERDKLKRKNPDEEVDELLAAENRKDISSSQPIQSDGQSQKLSRDDIVSLKAQGVSGKDIVDQLVENSSTYKDRTEFSKAKYRNKKTKKHISRITILRPTTLLIAEMYYSKGSYKICELRPDALSQILTLANIRAHSRVLVMEQCHGLVVGAILDRMGGYGSIVQIHSGDFPTRLAMECFNFSSNFMKIVNGFPLNKVNSLRCKSSLDPSPAEFPENSSELLQQTEVKQEEQLQPQQSNEASDEAVANQKQEEKVARRVKRQKEESAARNDLELGNMDGLVIACKFQPSPILLGLLPFVAPSRPFVIFSQYKEPLMECYVNLRARGGFVNLQLTETWWRHYQVLPARTHPEVNMNSSGGYLLSGITVEKDHKPEKTSTPNTSEPIPKKLKQE